MAAHDDKISTNRRRLFKALSAAPVLITLDSGAAEALSSAYQCVTNIPIENVPPTLDELGPSATAGFEALTLNYWRVGDGVAVNRVDCLYDPDTLIVEVIIDQIFMGYYDTASPGSTTIIPFDRNENNDKLTIKTAGGEECRKNVGMKSGSFAVLGEGVDGNTAFRLDGPYPKVNPLGKQGITTTCLNSVPLVTGSSRRTTLSIG